MSKSISLFIVVLLFVCSLFFSKCQKEYSYEGGPVGNTTGSAVFTCTGITVMGNYYTATSLDQTNTVQLQVNVTIAGTFSVTTNTSNGIKFSASGAFTGTGLQTITLNGSGAPVSSPARRSPRPASRRRFRAALSTRHLTPTRDGHSVARSWPRALRLASMEG